MALGLTDKIGYAVVLALAARLTLLNRNFVNGPYTQPTTAQTVVDVQRRIRDIRALTRAYEPVFGTISKVHGSYEVNKGVGEPYGRFHSFKLFDGGFDYSMDWHLGGPGTPISFNCTCHNVLEPADEARLPDALSRLPLTTRLERAGLATRADREPADDCARPQRRANDARRVPAAGSATSAHRPLPTTWELGGSSVVGDQAQLWRAKGGARRTRKAGCLSRADCAPALWAAEGGRG